MFAVAVIIGLAGMYFANAFIQNRVATYESQLKGDLKTTKVVVPQSDLPQGSFISTDNMSIREIPSIYVHRDAVTPEKFEIAAGQRLSFQLDQGKPLLWAHLEGGSAPTFSGKVLDGKRAITIPVDEINSISGLLQPKDRIDLLLTLSRDNSKITFPLLQDVLVMATGTKVNTEKTDPATGATTSTTYRTATLLVTQEDAKRIVLAQDAGKLTAVLRNPSDSKSLPNQKITVANLLDEGGPAKRQGPSIEFIIGGR